MIHVTILLPRTHFKMVQSVNQLLLGSLSCLIRFATDSPEANLDCIRIHMLQRTSKILLVRLTAIKNALLFHTRVTCSARYTE